MYIWATSAESAGQRFSTLLVPIVPHYGRTECARRRGVCWETIQGGMDAFLVPINTSPTAEAERAACRFV